MFIRSSLLITGTGGVSIRGATFRNGSFDDNTPLVAFKGTEIALDNCLFEHNHLSQDILISIAAPQVTIEECRFVHNSVTKSTKSGLIVIEDYPYPYYVRMSFLRNEFSCNGVIDRYGERSYPKPIQMSLSNLKGSSVWSNKVLKCPIAPVRITIPLSLSLSLFINVRCQCAELGYFSYDQVVPCIACSAGKYADTYNATECLPCPRILPPFQPCLTLEEKTDNGTLC